MLAQSNPQWNVTWVNSIEKLRSLTYLSQVHVFVFDQRLSNSDLGTEAFKYVLGKNPLTQGVMLSGVALADDLESIRREVAPAHVPFLSKTNIELLPEYVRNAIDGYYLNKKIINRTVVTENIIISKRRWLAKFSRSPLVTILRYYVVNHEYTFENDWIPKSQVRKGESRKDVKVFKAAISKTIVHETQSKIDAEASVSDDLVIGALSSYFNRKFSTEIKEACEYEHTTEITQQMPSESGALSITYHDAPAYKFIKVAVSIKCYCCNHTSYDEYDVFIPTRKRKERADVVYEDGSKKQIYT